jgi:hypothetical protein
MSYFTRNFTLARTRTQHGAITDASGWTGFWPFRSWISYHIGVNCDAIAQVDGRLLVYRRGRVIASAQIPLNTRFNLLSLLMPRHTRGPGR